MSNANFYFGGQGGSLGYPPKMPADLTIYYGSVINGFVIGESVFGNTNTESKIAIENFSGELTIHTIEAGPNPLFEGAICLTYIKFTHKGALYTAGQSYSNSTVLDFGDKGILVTIESLKSGAWVDGINFSLSVSS